MRGLSGDFGTMPLRDLVVYLGNRRASGTLTTESRGVRKVVLLAEGMIVNASSNRPREFLGQFLINMGQLSEDQFARAYQSQQSTQVMLGKILVQEGIVSETAVTNALNLKFRETLLSAFAWTEGSFAFEPREIPKEAGLAVSVDLLDIAREGEFRETAWQAIRAVFPSGLVRLAVRRENLAETPAPGTIDARLFQLIEDGASVDEIVLALHATDFYLYQRLYALYRLEALEVLEVLPEARLSDDVLTPQTPQVMGDESSAEEILAHAQNFFEAGNLEDSATLARRAYEMSATGISTAFLRQVESALTAQLRTELTEDERVPQLRVAPMRLKTLPLTAPERYLLSRIDGLRTVRAIIQVSPIHELDALRYFRGFVTNNLVALEASSAF